MQEAQCDKALMDVKFMANTKIADSEREYKMNQAAYQKEVNTAVRILAIRLINKFSSLLTATKLERQPQLVSCASERPSRARLRAASGKGKTENPKRRDRD